MKPNIIPQSGWVTLCNYCGEQIGNSKKYCPSCKTQAGRKEIFDKNVAILKEKTELKLPVLEGLKNWK